MDEVKPYMNIVQDLLRWMIPCLWGIIRHKWFILLVSHKIGLPLWRVLIHDLSKFSRAELPHYSRQFCGDKGDASGFACALAHHHDHNDHHWEHWKNRNICSQTQHNCLPMPAVCVKEMVADWMGAGRLKTGSWDMSEWLVCNLSKMKLHPETRNRVETELARIGYDVSSF